MRVFLTQMALNFPQRERIVDNLSLPMIVSLTDFYIIKSNGNGN